MFEPGVRHLRQEAKGPLRELWLRLCVELQSLWLRLPRSVALLGAPLRSFLASVGFASPMFFALTTDKPLIPVQQSYAKTLCLPPAVCWEQLPGALFPQEAPLREAARVGPQEAKPRAGQRPPSAGEQQEPKVRRVQLLAAEVSREQPVGLSERTEEERGSSGPLLSARP